MTSPNTLTNAHGCQRGPGVILTLLKGAEPKVALKPAQRVPNGGTSAKRRGKELIMKTLINRFVKDESGATAIEYGLIAALIAVAIITALTALGGNISGRFNLIASSIGN
jgi:pilus assembly protein Flp/PilA